MLTDSVWQGYMVVKYSLENEFLTSELRKELIKTLNVNSLRLIEQFE